MSEAFLNGDVRAELARALETVTKPVEAVVFTAPALTLPGLEAGLSAETLALLREVAEASGKLTVLEQPITGPDARELGLTRAPTILLREAGSTRTNVRFSGLPSGYEFGTLVEAIRLIGTGEDGLGEKSRAEAAKIDRPVTLQAFVTPTCPYCPRAVVSAIKLALVNDNVTAEGIEANEFPEISTQYRISSVPDTVITAPATSERPQAQRRVLGGQPEHVFLKETLAAIGA